MTSWIRRIVLSALMVVTLAGCAGGGEDLKPIESADVPTTYSLATGDRLRVSVFGHPDVSGEFEIDADGTITFPLLGPVDAAGKSVEQLKTHLAQQLDASYLVDPRVTVEVLNYRPFYILGEVGSPGGYPYQPGMTVQQAVALAGGFTRRAVTSEVTITRETDDGSVKLGAGQDARVLPGDTIRVDRRFF